MDVLVHTGIEVTGGLMKEMQEYVVEFERQMRHRSTTK